LRKGRDCKKLRHPKPILITTESRLIALFVIADFFKNIYNQIDKLIKTQRVTLWVRLERLKKTVKKADIEA
jgi:hypothetical protein